MKALTLTQPWASAVALGVKRIETRSWSTSYRGPLAIHAAKSMPAYARFVALANLWPDHVHGRHVENPLIALGYETFRDYPRGAIVATCVLSACTRIAPAAPNGEISSVEAALGDYTPGRFAWFLTDIMPLPEPIPARGALGLWDWRGPI